MTSDPTSPAHASPAPPTAPVRSARSYSDLARKIRGRTTDLLAIGVVLIAGLTLGRQVLRWWKTDDAGSTVVPIVSATAAPISWGEGGSPVDLQFGDQATGFSRMELSGTKEQALQRLVAHCTDKTRQATLPHDLAPESELRLLERISKATPVQSETGVWSVYVIDQPLPLVLGVRIAPATPGMPPATVEQSPRRVVCWGWLFAQEKASFTAYCVQAAGSGSSSAGTGAEIPLPSTSRRIVSIHGSREGSLISFLGPGPVEGWMQFYDNWGQKQGWGPLHWERAGAAWSARVRDLRSQRELAWRFSKQSPTPAGTDNWVGLIDLIPIRESRGNP